MKLYVICSLEKPEGEKYTNFRFMIAFDNKKEAKQYLNLFMPRQYFIITVRGKSFLQRSRLEQEHTGWKNK